MAITSYTDPQAFLNQTRTYLERNEAATALILGMSLRMVDHGFETQPYLAVADSPAGIELVAMMTPPHRLVLWSEQPDPLDALGALARDLRDHNWGVAGALGPPHLAEPWLERWQALTGESWRLTMRERIYELTAVTPPAKPAPGRMRAAGPDDFDLAARWAWEFHDEALGEDAAPLVEKLIRRKIDDGSLFLWEDDGQPVSMAGYGRDTARSSTISLVYTPPEARRRGYAMALVAALSQQRLDAGKHCCTLFTDLGNPTSNSIYQQIGYRPVCDFNAYDIEKG
ncbi:MAG TPA: GNAT family N-acetyltransferase [Herpetosiphonaceae bacterium]|nr:GNAT family N-acetyltransferase [Herpetosiphonaceae bacterium]